MSLLLTEKDVLALCGRTYTERGRSYQRQGRVLDLQWEQDEEVLYGRVKGSGRNLYEQSIRLYPRRPPRPFEGECSCPVEYNCKHVAAVLLEWLGRKRAPQPAALPQKRRESELALWQKQFRQVFAATAPPPASGHALIYLLKPQTYRESTKIFLHVCKSRPLKRGGWSRPTPFNPQQFAGYQYYRPDWVTSQDMEILELARHGLSGASTPAIAGDVGVLLLRRLLTSGCGSWRRSCGTFPASRRQSLRPGCRRSCAPTSGRGSPGCSFCGSTASAASSPTTWGWARPCRRWRTCSAKSAPAAWLSRRWWSPRPASSATGGARRPASPPSCASSCCTARSGRSTSGSWVATT